MSLCRHATRVTRAKLLTCRFSVGSVYTSTSFRARIMKQPQPGSLSEVRPTNKDEESHFILSYFRVAPNKNTL